MARRRRSGGQTAAADDRSLRIRAAWLYHSRGLTQKAVSERLGVSRGTVIRLLGEAKDRGEVQVWIAGGEARSTALAVEIEDALGLEEAIVVPADAGGGEAGSAAAVGLALGQFLSSAVTDGMTIGVGWGRTLSASLASLRPQRRAGVRIVSLLGGVVEARQANPLDYSWRVANQFGADCYLFVAPAFVDSVTTKQRLIEACGLDRLYRLAGGLDMAVVSVGDIGRSSTSLAAGMISRAELGELVAMGCVGDVLCNFLDAEGNSVPHALNRRVMSVDLEDIRNAGHVVIASAGAHRAAAIRAAIRRIGCSTLVTDEATARALLAGPGAAKNRRRE